MNIKRKRLAVCISYAEEIEPIILILKKAVLEQLTIKLFIPAGHPFKSSQEKSLYLSVSFLKTEENKF